jgi:hypothetical protein
MQKEIRKLIRKVSGPDLKTFIKSTKACRGGAAWDLEAKFGILSLQFADLDVDEALISFRRKSGNGLVIVVSGANLADVQISSKINHDVTIKLDQSKILDIKRPFRSRGSIEVLSVALWNNHFMMDLDWNSVLKKCHEHTCLRLVDGKLMASEGAMIVADAISNVITAPANMFTLSDDRVVFLGACEILDMTISGVGSEVPEENYMKHHLETEPAVLSPAEPSEPSRAGRATSRPRKALPNSGGHSSRLLYDSQSMGFNDAFANKDVKTLDSHVVLGSKGEYKIPARFVEANHNYVLVIEASNLRGNGKLSLALKPGITINGHETILAARNTRPFNTTVRSSSDSSCLHHVTIGRHPSATGDVSISRVMVLADFDRSYQLPESVRSGHMPSGDPLLYQPLFHDATLYVPEVVGDEVAVNSKRYARHRSMHSATRKIPRKATVKVHTDSGMSWLGKIQPLVPDVVPTEKTGDLCIGIAGALSEAARIYLEEFKLDDLTEKDLEKLSRAKRIMSPSSSNVEHLRSKLSTEVVHMPRLWPYTVPEKLVPVENYMVTFNRDPVITRYVIDAINGVAPKLVVLGARGAYPEWVVPVNEYLGYQHLLHLLCSARCVIDVPPIYDYTSAALSLVQAAQIPIVSSNWMCMEGGESHFVIAEQEHQGRRVPSTDALRAAAQEAIEVSVRNTLDESYNELFARNIDQLFA